MKITTLQAYHAMDYFLDDFHKKYRSSVIGGLLGSMSILEDGLPVDQALWGDWLKALETEQSVTEREAYDAMIRFISDPYPEFQDAQYLNQLLKDIKEENYNGFYWKFWKQCVEKAIEHPVPLGIKWADE